MISHSGTVAVGQDPQGDAFQISTRQDRSGEHGAARETLEVEVARLRALGEQEPGAAAHRAQLAAATMNLGNLLRRHGDRDQAKAMYDQALDLLDGLLDSDRDNSNLQNEAARVYHNYGLLLKDEGKLPAAEEAFQKALRVRAGLLGREPGNRTVKQEYASTGDALATTLKLMGPARLTEAERHYLEAQSIQEELASGVPPGADCRRDLAVTRGNLAGLLQDMGRYAEAEELYRKSQADYESLLAAHPAAPEYRIGLGICLGNWARLLRVQGRLAESRCLLEQALAHYREQSRSVEWAAPWKLCFRKDHQLLFEVLVEMKAYGDAAQRLETFPGELLGASECYRLASLWGWGMSQIEANSSLSADDARQLLLRYGDAAVGLLSQAVERGFADAGAMRGNTRLNALRSRADFHQLLQSLDRNGQR